ncbi:MAG: DNA primase [Oscillospiraceae bacterium]|nr:DNA primase [Oscillospiraceae bacterium]
MALPVEFLMRLKDANDITTAFSSYGELRRAGRDYVCLCPFHSEKSPSCHIYTDDPHFYCFGCGKGGDVITFTQLTQNLDYISAVRLLAERSGIPMPDDGRGKEGETELKRRTRMYDANKAAAKFFRDCLQSESGRDCYAFLRGRGLNDNTIRKYGIGYAPSGNEFKYHMNALGFRDTELAEASLLKQNESGAFRGTFWERAMFPVIDRTGKVIAFSGRRIDGGKDYKYVNSAETAVYKKGENLFSINFAKNTKSKTMILCEGNIDAVMLNQAGFDNTVAILGTALTPAQARLLRFYCEDAVLAFDADAAGEKATVKAINLLNKEGMTARVLQMPAGQDGQAYDPDSYIKAYGVESFALLLEKTSSAIAFELNKLKSAAGIDTADGRALYLSKSVEFLAQVENDTERMVYASEIAADCNVTSSGVLDAVAKKRRTKSRGEEKAQKRELLSPAFKRDEVNPDASEFPVQEKAERAIIAYLFHSPDKLATILRELSPVDFPTTFNRKLFETLIIRLSKGQSIDTMSLGSEFSPSEMGRIEKIKITEADVPFTDERLISAIEILLKHKKSKSKKSASEMTNEEAMEYIKTKYAVSVLQEKRVRGRK